MIFCNDYKDYIGPNLIKAILDDEDITDKIKEIYGINKNWNSYLWTYKEVFGDKCYGKNFRFDFKSDDGRDHFFHGYINDINQYMNPPMSTPTNQNPKYWNNLNK